jgi:thiamine-monophosphate kinase
MTGNFSEFTLIAELFAPLATLPGAFGLADDAAIIMPRPGWEQIVTTDTVIAGVDFLPDDSPDLVARKALRVNLSDLAAKGAEPQAYLLNLSLPAGTSRDWLEFFARGLAEDQKTFGIALLGGDTGRTPGPLTTSVTAFGQVPQGSMIRRQGARIGDGVFVTGTIGDSGGGLAILRGQGGNLSEDQRQELIARYRLPQPRIGQPLRGIASAALDISDGLIADLGHLAEASGVRLVIEAEQIPRSPALRALWGDGLEAVLGAATAGDDYEIAYTAASGDGRIGHVEQGSGVSVLWRGQPVDVPRPGYRHF